MEVKVFGPKSQAKVEITPKGNGFYDVQYHPTEPGEYKVHVTLDGKHIPGSIFTVIVLEDISLGGEGKIRVYYTTTTAKNEITRPLQELLEVFSHSSRFYTELYSREKECICAPISSPGSL